MQLYAIYFSRIIYFVGNARLLFCTPQLSILLIQFNTYLNIIFNKKTYTKVKYSKMWSKLTCSSGSIVGVPLDILLVFTISEKHLTNYHIIIFDTAIVEKMSLKACPIFWHLHTYIMNRPQYEINKTTRHISNNTI